MSIGVPCVHVENSYGRIYMIPISHIARIGPTDFTTRRPDKIHVITRDSEDPPFYIAYETYVKWMDSKIFLAIDEI